MRTNLAAPNTVIASNGAPIAGHAYTQIDKRRPSILAIHGYPDNHQVWDGIAEKLSHRYSAQHHAKYNFVAYDVRGAGESACPADRSGYRLPQLISDIGA